MKKIVALLTLALLVVSCGKGNSIEDKKLQLEELKKESTTLTETIKKLEEEIAKVTGVKPQNNTAKNVAIEAVALKPFKHYIDVQGKIDGDEDVNVSAKTPGTVSRILVKEGDEVVKGQVLAEMESYVLQQGLEEIKTALSFAVEMYDKQKNLWNQKIGTEVQFLSAKNNKESLEKKRATLQEQIELSKIKSPINGVVDAVDIKIGQALAPGLPALRIVNLNQLKVVGEVSETYASNVKKGNDVLVVFPDLTKQIEAKISYTSKVINAITRTFTTEARLDVKDPDYRPNMIAVLKILLKMAEK